VIVYPFIDADTSLAGMTNEQWQEVGTIFKLIHQVALPSQVRLKKETFDPTEYARRIHELEVQHVHARPGESDAERALRASWMAHQSTIHTAVTFLEKLAQVLQRQNLPYGICHADLHPANLLRDHAGRVFVIDWDEVMLAPKERDFIFVREPQAGAFFQGYGQTEIDWIALTYYLWERVVQDVIECAQDVFSRDDLGEETRAEIAQLFHEILVSCNSTINAAYATAAHLPLELNFTPKSIPDDGGTLLS
jgi:spectinomycin phosphotransferase